MAQIVRPEVVKTDRRVGGFRLLGRVWGSRPVYRLLRDIDYGDYIVPAGFETDFVSAPWPIRWALPLKGMCLAAILHDWLRRYALWLSLAATDRRFRREMIRRAVNLVVAWLCWAAVRTNHNRA